LDPSEWPQHGWFIDVVNRLIRSLPEERFESAEEIMDVFHKNWSSERAATKRVEEDAGVYPLLSIRSVPLIGRSDLLSEIKKWIVNDNYLPALLHGPTGAGKSRIAAQIHSECAQRNIPAVLFDAHIMKDQDVGFFQKVLSILRQNFFPEKPEVHEIFVGKGSGPGLTPTQFSFYVSGSVSRKPVVLIFDDLHLYSHSAFHEILQFFLLERNKISDLCVKWIFVYNDEMTSSMEIRGGSLLSDLLPTSLDMLIEPLTQPEVKQLAEVLLGKKEVSEGLVDEALTFSNGLPYAVADLLDVFLDKDILKLRGDCWRLDYGDGTVEDSDKLPANIIDQVLADQFEKLDVLSLEMLKILAVGGTKSSIGLVRKALQVPRDELDRVVK